MITRIVLVAIALSLVAVVWLLGWSLIGDPPEPALRRVGPPLGLADVQAIQDAEPTATGRATVPLPRRTGRIYLTDRETNQRAAELDKQLPADRWEQLAPLYLTPGEPGEHRTTWTREDYRS